MDCSELKSLAVSDYGVKSFSSGSTPLQIYESTNLSSATISETKGQFTATIPANTKEYVLMAVVEEQADGQSNSPPAEIDDPVAFNEVANEHFYLYNQLTSTTYTSATIPAQDPVFTDSNVCSTSTTTYGWKITNQQLVCQRYLVHVAAFNGTGGGSNPPMNGMGEYFSKSSQQTITSTESNISWDLVKTDSSGGAVGYPPPGPIGNAVSITGSTSINYGEAAPGFDRSRFIGSYRPCILLRFNPAIGKPVGTTATSITATLYINGNSVASKTSSSLESVEFSWAFSINGVGDFGDSRPPQNNSLDSYNGWVSPSVRIGVKCDSGTLDILKSTKLSDIVVNYPYS